MNQYSHRAAFSALALGLDALALATLGMLVLAALRVWPVALASGSTRLASGRAGPASNPYQPVSGMGTTARRGALPPPSKLTPLHLV